MHHKATKHTESEARPAGPRPGLVLFMICLSSLVFALVEKQQPPVAMKFVPAEHAKAGTTVEATIEVSIRKPWHIFSQNPEVKGITPSEFVLEACTGATLEKVTLSKPASKYNAVFDKNLNLYEDKMTITLTLKIDSGTTKEIPIQGRFQYQACSDKLCMPPKKEPFAAIQPLED